MFICAVVDRMMAPTKHHTFRTCEHVILRGKSNCYYKIKLRTLDGKVILDHRSGPNVQAQGSL